MGRYLIGDCISVNHVAIAADISYAIVSFGLGLPMAKASNNPLTNNSITNHPITTLFNPAFNNH